ncbi:GDP-mannose-dependent alpha-(1-6)-phosphatidylinositol monomannoside mannosyltransferase [Marinobacterium sp. xm-g-59]|uniref:glycosyltransferase family 4 protein n=1 Tax=Marinobacterium sp. xm-g-59 TaxID=2497748 RepID=UPI001567C7A4|nr:glycosyltransferase family 4 protein [Marinobacterium sp. xm-g-59]NRP96157.1 GDP-mannose-dependent alpha-(1-6)-phosphatidylinositol monomannoside mannosyltransferase [Marinobacterium sp. xm-g-59]
MKRLTIVTQTFPPRTGGMESVMFSLAKNLANADWNVSVVADKPLVGEYAFSHTAVAMPKFVRNIAKKLYLNLQTNPDLYLCDSWKSVEAIPNNGVPIVVLAHGQEYLDTKKRGRIKHALDRAIQIVSSSKATIELFCQYNQDYRYKAICIYPTYGLYEDTQVEPNSNFTAPLKILSLSRIEKRKGLFQSAAALRELHKRGLEIEWSIAGSGPDLEELKQECNDLSFVKFLGRVDDEEKKQLYLTHDIFLMPSYQNGLSLEGFGITYIEASQCGLPSIGGTAGGASEAVLDGVTGWCVDGEDSNKILDAINAAYRDRQLLSEYGKAAKERFDKELVSHIVTTAMSKCLTSIVKPLGNIE